MKKNTAPDFQAMSREMLKNMPKEVAQKAKDFFQASFIREGFTDVSFIPWVKRKDDLGHKILSHSLDLRNSIRIESATLNKIEISAGNGLKYAAIQNEGGTIVVPITDRVRKFFWAMYAKTDEDRWKYMALTKKDKITINIPKRQFIGDSHMLNNQIDQLMIKKIIQEQSKIRV